MEIGIISWLVVGLIAGILGTVIMPGRDPGGLLLTIVIGMIGALVGGLIVAATRGHGTYGVQRLVDPGVHPVEQSYCWRSTDCSRVRSNPKPVRVAYGNITGASMGR